MTTFFAGTTLAAGDLEALAEPSLCQVIAQTAQTGWTSATPTAITFGVGSTTIDTDSIHSESTNTSRLVIGLRLGWWRVEGLYTMPNSSVITTGRAIIYKNGSAILGSSGQIGAPGSGVFTSVPTKPGLLVQATSITDYVELYGYQTAASGTIGTAVVSPYIASGLTATWIRS